MLLCVTILVVTTIEKFREGGWITIGVTGALLALCYLIRGHYRARGRRLLQIHREMEPVVAAVEAKASAAVPAFDATRPTAALLVGGYGGLGIHSLLTILRTFQGHYHNLVIVCVGVLDSGEFKGEDASRACRPVSTTR